MSEVFSAIYFVETVESYLDGLLAAGWIRDGGAQWIKEALQRKAAHGVVSKGDVEEIMPYFARGFFRKHGKVNVGQMIRCLHKTIGDEKALEVLSKKLGDQQIEMLSRVGA